MKRYGIIIIVLIMAIGFAAVSTTLYIIGETSVAGNPDDFEVYYSDAYVNGLQDLSVVTGKRSINFTATLTGVGDTYILDYDVTNGSRFFDADIEVSCKGGNQYLKVENEFKTNEDLEALQTRRGTLRLTTLKTLAQDELIVDINCDIDAKSVERNSIADGKAAESVK